MNFKKSFLGITVAIAVIAGAIAPAYTVSAEVNENVTVFSDEAQSPTALDSVGEYTYSLKYNEETQLTFKAQETGTYVFSVYSTQKAFDFVYFLYEDGDPITHSWVCGKDPREIEVEMTAGSTYSFKIEGLNENNEYAEGDSAWAEGDSDTLHMMVYKNIETGISIDEAEGGVSCTVPAYSILKMKLNVPATDKYFFGTTPGTSVTISRSVGDIESSTTHYSSFIDKIEAGTYDVLIKSYNEEDLSPSPFTEETEVNAVFSALPYTGAIGDITFEFDKDCNLSFSGSGEMKELDSYPWNTFGKTMFISTLKIESGIKSIASGAFEGMRGIISVYLPETVEKIGDNAFSGSSLSSITIENPECVIGENALPDELVEISCYKGSTADKYASEKGIEVYYLDSAEFIPGDISGNGKIDLYDAIEICKYIMGMRTFTDDEMVVADYDGNGKVDLYDAIGIAKELLGNIK